MAQQYCTKWKRILETASFETDETKLVPLAYELEDAIVERHQELLNSHDGITEQIALLEASERLYQIRVEKLGFPDWRKRNF